MAGEDAVIGLLITAILFPLVGLAITRVVGRTSAYLMGLGVVGGVLHVMTLVHVPPMMTIAGLIVGAVAVLLRARWSAGNPAGDVKEKHAGKNAGAPLVVALIPIAVLLFTTAITPLHDFDGRAFWLLKARAIANEKRIDGPFFKQQDSMYNPRNEYPLLIPFDAAAVMMLSGDGNDRQVRWIYVLALAALALHARRFVGAWPAALIPWIPQFAASPAGSAATAYNDVPLAAFGACAFFELIERKSPLRFGLWLSFLVLTKNEGLPFAIFLLGAGMVVFRRRVVISAAPFAAALTTLLVWRSLIPAGDEENLSKLLTGVHQHLDRLLPAVVRFLAHAFGFHWWGLFWLVVIAVAAFIISRDGWPEIALAVYVIGSMLALYTAVYMVTTWDLVTLLNASADRLLMHVIGPAVYIIGVSGRSRYNHAPRLPIEV